MALLPSDILSCHTAHPFNFADFPSKKVAEPVTPFLRLDREVLIL